MNAIAEKRLRDVRDEIRLVLGININKVQIGENQDFGEYLKVDARGSSLPASVIYVRLMQYIYEFEKYKIISVIILTS